MYYEEVPYLEINSKQAQLSSKSKIVAAVIVSVFSLVAMVYGFYQSQMMDVKVLDGSTVYEFRTMQRTVAAVLAELELSLAEEDVCQPLAETVFAEPLTIKIRRALPLTIEVDGLERQLKSAVYTVSELLTEQDIVLGADDRITPELETNLEAGIIIDIVRVSRQTQTINHPIPFSIIREHNQLLEKGIEETVRFGQEGVQLEILEVIYEDGVPVEQTTISSELVQQAVDQVIHVGAASGPGYYNKDGVEFVYSNLLFVETTGYDACYYCCGKHPGEYGYGITYSGMLAGKGVIGADLTRYPIGTKLYVEGYGFCVVGDTGGALRGTYRLDLGFATHEEAVAWALNRNTPVYVLD